LNAGCGVVSFHERFQIWHSQFLGGMPIAIEENFDTRTRFFLPILADSRAP
jgi:hypothetical protein